MSGDFGGNPEALPPLSPNASVDEALQWWSEISVQQWEAFYVGFDAHRFLFFAPPSECTEYLLTECRLIFIEADPLDRLLNRLSCLIQNTDNATNARLVVQFKQLRGLGGHWSRGVCGLTQPLQSTVTIGLTVTNQGGATGADYSGVPQSVTFAPGQTTTGFTVAAAADGIADSGESVVLGFGALPEGVTAGQNTSTIVTIVEAVVRDVSVSFSSRRYEVMEGQQVEVVVELSEALDDPIMIMLTTANLGGATGADYSGIPERVTFAPGETRKSFLVLATDDAADESGEGVELGFGTPLPEGITVHVTDSTATVNILISGDAVSPAERIVVEETLKAVAAGAVANVTSNIGARFSGVRSGAPVLTLAGQPVALEPGLSTQAGFDQYRRSSWSNGLGLKGRSGSLSATDLLRTTVFQVSLGASERGNEKWRLVAVDAVGAW